MARLLRANFVLPLLAMALLTLVSAASASNTRGRLGAAIAQAERLETSIEAFQRDCGRLPYALDELVGVVSHDDCRDIATLRLPMLTDPWGNTFSYWRAADGRTFEVRSIGPDRVYANADDVSTSDWEWPWPRPWNWEVIGSRAFVLTVLLALAATVAHIAFVVLRRLWRVARLAVRGVSR